MISQALQDAINDQIQAEYYSSYLYLSMAAYCEAENLQGFGHWMRVQSQEELGHALKFFDHLIERGGRALLKPIEPPPHDFGSPLGTFERALEHERLVTGRIERLYQLAQQESDPTTQTFLQWFLTEQVEEEATATQIVATLRRIGPSAGSLVMLDHQLAKREA